MGWFGDDNYGDSHKVLEVKHPKDGYTYKKFDERSLAYNNFAVNFVSNNYGAMFQTMLQAGYKVGEQDIVELLIMDARTAWIMLGHQAFIMDAGLEGED